MSHLLSLAFWFNVYPPRLSQPYGYLLIMVTLALMVGTIVFGILKNKKGKNKNFHLEGFRKLYYFSFTNAIIGILLIFFNFEEIPFFSARFWYPVWIIEMVVWIYFVFKFFRYSVPEKLKKAEQEERY